MSDDEVRWLLGLHESCERILAHVDPADDHANVVLLRKVAAATSLRLRHLGVRPFTGIQRAIRNGH